MHRLLLPLILLAGCALPGPETTDRVDLLLWSPACEPEAEPPFENWIEEGAGLTVAWDVLCTRDDAETSWFAVKISRWDDRADDMWNVWYLDPARRAVEYAEDDLPGVTDAQNPDSPDANVRVEPRDLVAGDYRVEVWNVPGNIGDAVVSEAKLTVLGDE